MQSEETKDDKAGRNHQEPTKQVVQRVDKALQTQDANNREVPKILPESREKQQSLPPPKSSTEKGKLGPSI